MKCKRCDKELIDEIEKYRNECLDCAHQTITGKKFEYTKPVKNEDIVVDKKHISLDKF